MEKQTMFTVIEEGERMGEKKPELETFAEGIITLRDSTRLLILCQGSEL